MWLFRFLLLVQKFLLGEMARWGKVVKDNNIRPD
jgi:hypothetical protein